MPCVVAGLGTESLSDSDLSELLEQLESSVSKVRKAQDARRERRREALARDLMCPITGEIVKDPVVATDGEPPPCVHCDLMVF